MKRNKCVLSVNVNKIATLRNSRGGNVPHLITCVKDLIQMGAEGITVHPRPDERHIKLSDVKDIAHFLSVHNRKLKNHSTYIEFNIEGYPSADFIRLLKKYRPEQATLVPDPPHVLTSNAGWRLSTKETFLKKVVRQIQSYGIRVSLFVDPYQFTQKDLYSLRKIKPDRIELYTEKYAKDYVTNMRSRTTARYAHVAESVAELGIGINAGHDLSSENLNYLVRKVPQIAECSIGHALMSEALYLGFERCLKLYLHEIRR